MDAYDVIRAFLIREQKRQNILTGQLRADLALAQKAQASHESLTRIADLAGQMHDAGVLNAYLGEALAGYPMRQRTEAAS